MFARLFGETEEMQAVFLRKRVMGTAVGRILVVLGVILLGVGLASVGDVLRSAGGIVLMVVLFIWGFGAVKALLGIGTVGAIFSRNPVFAAVILAVCAILAYLVSLIVACLGVGRYIYLRVKWSQVKG